MRKLWKQELFGLLLLALFLSMGSMQTKAAPKLNQKSAAIAVGKTVRLSVKGTKKKVKWKSLNKNVATVNAKGKVTGKKQGRATITAKAGAKTLKCKVRVLSAWFGVKVIVPETIGEQDYPSNRMKITKYSFYKRSYSSTYYMMDFEFKLVKYGKTGKRNWGEYFYCYDENGDVLKKCYMYASSLALDRTYRDDAMIPMGTAKIVFMEYPDDEASSAKWSYADALQLKSYAEDAKDCSSKAYDEYNEAFAASGSLKTIYANMALDSIKLTKANLDSALQLAQSKPELHTTDGRTLAQVIQDAKAAYDAITIEQASSDNIEELMEQFHACIPDGDIKCLAVYVLSVKLLESF